jgi:ribosomal protein S19
MQEMNVLKNNLRKFYMPQDILRKYLNNKLSYINFKIQSKNFIINRDMLDNDIFVYTGRLYYLLKIKHDMVGQKIGEFISTRQFLKKRLKFRSKYRRKRNINKK